MAHDCADLCRHPRRGARQLSRPARAAPTPAWSCCATTPATPSRPATARWGCRRTQLERHIAYDIGAAPGDAALAAALGAPAVLTRYSRLLIDPNRGADDPTLIMRLSDGAVIPGNRRLDEAERERRIAPLLPPYHRAIDASSTSASPAGAPPALLSIHSFTESWKDVAAAVACGRALGQGLRLAKPLLDGFYAEGDLIVGDNEPYTGQLEGDCLWQHATSAASPMRSSRSART